MGLIEDGLGGLQWQGGGSQFQAVCFSGAAGGEGCQLWQGRERERERALFYLKNRINGIKKNYHF